MSKKIALLAGAACIALAASASAQAATHTTTTRTHTTETERTIAPATTTTTTYETAKPAPAVYSAFTGMYMGGYGGYGWNHANNDGGVTDLSANGFEYGAFVGYSLNGVLDRYMGLGLTGALEGHFGWSNAKKNKTIGGIDTKFDKKYEWGVDFRPGLTYLDSYLPFGIKPYGIVGFRQAEYDETGGAGSGRKNFQGLDLGFGTEFLTYEHFGVRADYNHVFYNERHGVSPSENDIRGAVVFHF